MFDLPESGPESMTVFVRDHLNPAFRQRWGTKLVTPELLGAIGDGVTDDTSAVQNAFNLLASGYDVYLPGLYRITSTISVAPVATLANRSIRGRGKTVNAFYTEGNIACITLSCAAAQIAFLTISDFACIGANAGTRTSEAAIRILGSSAHYFTHNTIKSIQVNNLYHGILFDSATGGGDLGSWNMIADVDTVNSVYYGIKFLYGTMTGGVILGGNIVLDGSSGIAAVWAGDGVTSIGDLMIAGLQTGGHGTGVRLKGNGTYGNKISITGCQFDGGITTSLDLDNVNQLQANGIGWGGATNWTIAANCQDIELMLDQTIAVAQITADQNNYNPPNFQFARRLELNASAIWSMTGLAGGFDGRELELYNAGTFIIALQSDSGSSTAANRLHFAAAVWIYPGETVRLRYRGGTTSRWTAAGTVAALSGVVNGTYGSASQSPAITLDSQGRALAAANVTITPAAIGAAPTTRAINTTSPLTGGGDLSADRTHALDLSVTYNFSNTTDATSAAAAAVKTAGGFAAAKIIWAGTQLNLGNTSNAVLNGLQAIQHMNNATSVYYFMGQQNGAGVLFQWNYNATPSSASANFATSSYANPLTLDAALLYLQVNSTTPLVVGGQLDLMTGTTAKAPLFWTAGVNLTTAAAGAQEFDGKAFYATAVASARQVIDCEQVAVLTADYTLTDNNTAQKALNASANGALTLAASTTYEFEALYLITNTGTTSHTWSVLFGGTATLTSIAYLAQAHTATGNALTAVSQIYAVAATAVVVTAASVSATENVVIKLRGTIRTNAAGTLIPQVQLSAATGGTEKMLKNSFFRCWPIGVDTVATVGNWS